MTEAASKGMSPIKISISPPLVANSIKVCKLFGKMN